MIALLIPTGGDILALVSGIINGKMMSNSYQTTRFILRLLSYILNIVPIAMSSYCSMTVYQNIVRKSDTIRQLFLGSNTDIEKGIKEIKDWSYAVFPLHKGSEERKSLDYANAWVTCNVICYVFWIIAYSLYIVLHRGLCSL